MCDAIQQRLRGSRHVNRCQVGSADPREISWVGSARRRLLAAEDVILRLRRRRQQARERRRGRDHARERRRRARRRRRGRGRGRRPRKRRSLRHCPWLSLAADRVAAAEGRKLRGRRSLGRSNSVPWRARKRVQGATHAPLRHVNGICPAHGVDGDIRHGDRERRRLVDSELQTRGWGWAAPWRPPLAQGRTLRRGRNRRGRGRHHRGVTKAPLKFLAGFILWPCLTST